MSLKAARERKPWVRAGDDVGVVELAFEPGLLRGGAAARFF